MKYRCLTSSKSVGIEFNKDIINIYFPLGYDIPVGNDETTKIEEKQAILDLLKTISLCKNNGDYEEYNYNDGDSGAVPVSSYLWIINDYLKNGLYNIIDKKYIVSQKGKINWKRTFRTKPLFTDDKIIYLNPITEVKTKDEDIITEIHSFCIEISIDQIGWLFGNIDKPVYRRTYSNELYLNILNKELVNTFNDRKKVLLKHLIKIVKNKSLNDKLDKVNNLLVDNYHYAWEKMISYVFGNDNANIKEYFPKIEWRLKYDKNPNPKMRPDTVINKEHKLYIIDGKYYQYATISNGRLPGAEDVDKQITYGDFGKNMKDQNGNKKFDNVYNAFVLPFNSNDQETRERFEITDDSKVWEVGYVTSNARVVDNTNDESHKRIAIILMDTKFLIDCYLRKQNVKDKILIDSILNAIKDIKDS